MKIDDSEVLQLLIPNLNLKNIVKESFLKDLEEKYGENVKIISLNIIIGDKEGDIKPEMIRVSHPSPILEEENKLLLDVKTPENIEMMFEIIKKHRNEG
jgi:hypothetical protein